MTVDPWKVAEITAVALNIGFTILIAVHRRIGWLMGFVASCIGVAIYIHEQAWVMTGLNAFYAAMGLYGWWTWGVNTGEAGIARRSWRFHTALLPAMAIIMFLSVWAASHVHYGAHPFMEVFIAVFSFVATWMMAHRMIENWIYWVVGDAVAVWFNHLIGLEWYALLNVVYIVLSIIGLWRWNRAYRSQVEVSPRA